MSNSGLQATSRGMLFASVVVLFGLLAGCSPSLDDVGEEVWILGLDGADWDMVGPLIDRGLMPNLASLRDGGASGVLRSDEPMLSPVLWNSIATGRTPDVHGVTWFMTDAPDGSKVPVSTFDRRVHAVWNVADEAGMSAGVVGWWASWPAEHLDGFVVTDYVGWHSFGMQGRESVDSGEIWPPEIDDEVRSAMPHPDDVSVDLLERLVHLPRERLAAGQSGSAFADDLNHLCQSIATTRGYTDIVKERLRDKRPELLCLYYEGTDATMHLFGDFMEPRQPWVSMEDYAAYRDVVNNYWIWQDELLGELLELRGPRTTIVVVSDHGFRTGDERRKEDRFNIETADADHMIDGVIVVNGPGTPAGVKIHGAEIYDVAPTVLYSLGLPVARNMAGKVLADAFHPEEMAERPIAWVESFENRPLERPPLPDQDEGASEAMEQMLRSLGYIAGASDTESGDEASAPASTDGAVSAHTAEQSVNLATILMKQGRLDEAVTELRTVLESHPENAQARLNLAQALARSGQNEEAEQLYRGMMDEYPDNLNVYEDLAMTLGRSGRPADALDVYDAGLARSPEWVAGLSGKGNALFLLGRSAEAEQQLRSALEIDPRHHGTLYYLGLLQIDEGDLSTAATTLKKAHDLEPAEVPTALRLASVYERTGRPADGLAVLRRVYENGGDEPELRSQLGAALMNSGDTAAAVPHLRAAAEARPDDVAVLGNLGLAQAMGGDLPAAAATFERVVVLEPDMPASHTQLGMFYAQMGSVDKAEHEFREAVRCDGADPVSHLHLGMLLHQTGRTDEARTVYRETVELAPDMALALYNLGMLEGGAGNHDEAARLIGRARELDPSLPAPGSGRSN